MQKLCCVRTRQHPLPVWSHKFVLSSTTHISTNSRPILVGIVSMAHTCPDDRQSSPSSSTVTATSYIQVTQILNVHLDTTSPYEGHACHSSFSRLLHLTSGLFRHISRLPKILHWLCLTLQMMLALWGAPYECPRQGVLLDLHLPTIHITHLCLLLVYYPKMGSDTFLSKT